MHMPIIRRIRSIVDESLCTVMESANDSKQSMPYWVDAFRGISHMCFRVC